MLNCLGCFLLDTLNRVILKERLPLYLLTLRLSLKVSMALNRPALLPHSIWRAGLEGGHPFSHLPSPTASPILGGWHFPMVEQTLWLKLRLRWTQKDKTDLAKASHNLAFGSSWDCKAVRLREKSHFRCRSLAPRKWGSEWENREGDMPERGPEKQKGGILSAGQVRLFHLKF